jgi:hypothetical protein
MDHELKSLGKFLAEELPPVHARVEGLIPGGSGLVILAGLQKTGKSCLAISLFASLATGRDFLDRPVQPEPAAYFFLEGSGELHPGSAAETAGRDADGGAPLRRDTPAQPAPR